ncbi:MAG TPA: hypothetical protein VGI40_22390 [Pirellulaceae bacterium]
MLMIADEQLVRFSRLLLHMNGKPRKPLDKGTRYPRFHRKLFGKGQGQASPMFGQGVFRQSPQFMRGFLKLAIKCILSLQFGQ